MASLMYQIETGIPVPRALKGHRKTDPALEQAMRQLEVNQSLYVPNTTGDHLMPLQHKVICTISKIKQSDKLLGNTPKNLVTRQQGNGIRVWRIE